MSAIQHHAMLLASAASASSYLDQLSTAPVAACYLKKVISTATNCLRVRRSSDNTEQDFGFSGTAVDSAAIVTFCGAGDGFVTKLYDQTGHGFDAVQATAANQPKIVSAGSYLGRVTFDATNDTMKMTAVTMGSAYCGMYSRIKAAVGFGGTTARIMVESSPSYLTNTGAFIFYANQTGALYSMGIGANKNREDASLGISTYSQVSVLWDLTQGAAVDLTRAYINGSEITGTGSGSGWPATFSTYDINLGSRNAASNFSDMETAGFVFYNADTSGIRASIEAML